MDSDDNEIIPNAPLNYLIWVDTNEDHYDIKPRLLDRFSGKKLIVETFKTTVDAMKFIKED